MSTDTGKDRPARKPYQISDAERDVSIRMHIREAHEHARAAQELIYGPERVYRGFLYRLTLGRAQNALMGLLKRELNRKEEA